MPTTDEGQGIWVITDVATGETAGGARSSEDIGGGFGSGIVQEVRNSLTQRIHINADELKQQIGNLLGVVGYVFDQAGTETGILLQKIELAIEIGAEGQVSILGSGGKVTGKGGITLFFERKSGPH